MDETEVIVHLKIYCERKMKQLLLNLTMSWTKLLARLKMTNQVMCKFKHETIEMKSILQH